MPIKLLILDEFALLASISSFKNPDEGTDEETNKLLTEIPEVNIKRIVKHAQQKNFSCLQFLSTEQDTIFNDTQVDTIIKEVALLRKDPTINPKTLDIIEEGAKSVSSVMFDFLKFEVTN